MVTPPPITGSSAENLPTPEVYERDRHSISRTQLDEDALKIMYRMIRHGYKAYLVGGGVRDLLLGKAPKDYDIATDATPRQIKQLFGNSRVIGRRFRLVQIYFRGGKIVQVSTFRDFSDPIDTQDAQDGKALQISDNKYGTEATDAQRRDLTINGLFYDLSTFSIIDYVGGMRDLKDQIIRVIGDPAERFIEDPVRMVRVVRHAARASFTIDPAVKAAIEQSRELLLQCSTMRVYEEVKKDLTSGALLSILRLLADTSLLELLIPELTGENRALLSPEHPCSACLARLDEMVRTGHEISPTVALALITLFHETGTTPKNDLARRFADRAALLDHARGCFSRLAVPRKERERLEHILAAWHLLSIYPKVSPAKLSAVAHKENLKDLSSLLWILEMEEALQASPSPDGESPEDDFVDQSAIDSYQSDGSADSEPRRRRRRRRGGRGRGGSAVPRRRMQPIP